MIRVSTIILVCCLLACSNHSSKKDNPLAKEINAFLYSGKYMVEVRDNSTDHEITDTEKGKLNITNNLGFITFQGVDRFKELDSFEISSNDSTIFRRYSRIKFMGTVLVSKGESGLDEDYFGYIFGDDNTGGGISKIKEFRHLFKKEDMSGRQYLYIIGYTHKSNNIIIRQIEREIQLGKITVNIDQTFILKPNDLR